MAMGAGPALGGDVTFDVPGGSLAETLPEFARQAGLQIIAPAGEPGQPTIELPPLSGEMDAREALERLIAHSGLPGTPAHSWQAVAASGKSIGQRGALNAASALAMAAVELFSSPDVVDAARDEFERRRGDRPYQPLQRRVSPPLDYRVPTRTGS